MLLIFCIGGIMIQEQMNLKVQVINRIQNIQFIADVMIFECSLISLLLLS